MSLHLEENPGPRSRRTLLKGLGLGAAGLAGAAMLPGEAHAQRGGLDLAMLNFALNLEYLEAEYYTLAAAGVSIADAPFNIGVNGRGTLGPTIAKPNPKVPFTPGGLIEEYAQEIAQDERNHVIFLRQALGARAVARPKIDLLNSFNTAITVATNGAVTSFDPFANEVNFLLGAFVFEDVGVTAYKGAARLLANRDFLEAAAGILAVEAYHAGNVRTVLAALNKSDPSLGIAGVVQAISDLRDLADGSNDLDQGILVDGETNIVPTDDFSIAFSRSAQQVLNIVYLSGQGTPGGFFPMGLNGELR